MFEQSALHGMLYRSEKLERSIASQTVALSDMTFGPMRGIHIYPISDNNFFVHHPQGHLWYHYQSVTDGEIPQLQATYKDRTVPETFASFLTDENRFFYYYGQATWKDPRTGQSYSEVYYIQNEPIVTGTDVPNIQQMELPLTLQKLDYEQTFSYPEQLNHLLANVKTTYTDRFKRPVKHVHGRTYPMAMKKVTTTWNELPDSSYPKVACLTGTFFAVLDLEPTHTKEDEEEFHRAPGFYEEETPRGGKHKLVAIDSPIFKFRFSPGLELINESIVTFYGIHGTWLCDNPLVLDVSRYQTVGHTSHTITTTLERPDVNAAVQALQQKALENISMLDVKIQELYRTDTDDSHADFKALVTIYHSDIKPYALEFQKEQLPWIIEAYAKSFIPHREKHETLRNGLPYLVYLASIIIQERSF